MVNVNRCNEVRGGGGIKKIGVICVQLNVVLYEEMGKDLCLHLIQPFFNINKASRIPAFDDSHRKGRSVPPVMALTLEYLLWFSC